MIEYALKLFSGKFANFVAQIGLMEELFEASFTQLAQTQCKVLSKCGHCRRYMKLISARPQRLYCANCETAYSLPQNGVVKVAF